MINKMKKIFIFLLLYFFSLNALGAEQFNFDITEIEIVDNGNKFLGKKRGKVTTNNGINFEANNFEYIKDLNLLNAKGNIIVIDSIKKFKIYSNNATYKKTENIIFTKGKSKAISQNDNIEITADNFQFDRLKNTITADKNVVVKDKNKNYTIYSEFASYDREMEIIFTKGKSKAISQNDNIEITADNFQFDRLKNTITADKNVVVKDKIKNYTIYSEFASYDREMEIIFTKGKSKAISQNDNIEITADNFQFDRLKNTITADKNVVVKDKNKNYTIYSEFASYDREMKLFLPKVNQRQ